MGKRKHIYTQGCGSLWTEEGKKPETCAEGERKTFILTQK